MSVSATNAILEVTLKEVLKNMFSITHVPTLNSSPHCNISLFLRCPSMVCPAPRRFQAINYVLGGQIDKRIIDWLGRQSNEPSSSELFPATFSSPSRSLEGLFEQTQCPSRGPRLALALPLELHRNPGHMFCAGDVPGHIRNNYHRPWLCYLFIKTHFIFKN